MPPSICKAIHKTLGLLAIVMLLTPANAQSPETVPDTIEGHLAAGKNLAGGRDNTPDFYGLVTAICVAPQRGAPAPDAPAPREDPNRKAAYMPPKKAFDDVYWMGTDLLGRDTFSRLMLGIGQSFAVAFASVAGAAVAGSLIGLLAAWWGGLWDGVLMRLMDVLLAFPAILLALLIIAIVGPGTHTSIAAITIVYTPIFARMVRGVLGVARRGVRMVSCPFVIAGFMMLSGFAMMARRVFVMFCCLIVVVRCFLGHVDLP